MYVVPRTVAQTGERARGNSHKRHYFLRGNMLQIRGTTRKNIGLYSLVLSHVAIVCFSLVLVSERFPAFDINYDPNYRLDAILGVTFVALLSAILFTKVEFSFGYFVGFYLYTAVVGFVWLSYFSAFPYDHAAARISAIASIVAFLVPAMWLKPVLKKRIALTPAMFDRTVMALLLLSGITLAIAGFYDFKIVGVEDASNARATLVRPRALTYAIGIVTGAALPFVFSCYYFQRQWLLAGASLCLMMLFYPVTLSKLVLVAPFMMAFLCLLGRAADTRLSTILSLTIPAVLGISMWAAFGENAIYLLGFVNLRLLAVPASALDHYNDFFSTHPTTSFCQILFVKSYFGCLYKEPLSEIMARAYSLGNYNASLLATEGIASSGIYLAPISTFICGVMVAAGNAVSARLPPSFVLVSSSMLVVTLLNVPLTTTLITNGGAVLFLLWYATPVEYLSETKTNQNPPESPP
jgi:hypothetical protein